MTCSTCVCFQSEAEGDDVTYERGRLSHSKQKGPFGAKVDECERYLYGFSWVQSHIGGVWIDSK